MKIKACSQLIHPMEYSFPSKSEPGKTYTVISESILNDAFCDCPGWNFRETCSHVKEVEENHCWWHAKMDTQIQECPICGGPVEEYELEPEWI